jgi:hypothetical protein
MGGPRRDPGAAAPSGATRIPGKDHVVDVKPPADGCRAGQPCVVNLEAIALGDFKINPEYPHRFVPSTSADLTVAPGPFTTAEINVASVPLTVVVAAPGPVTLWGELKVGVCNADRCEITETPVPLALVAR